MAPPEPVIVPISPPRDLEKMSLNATSPAILTKSNDVGDSEFYHQDNVHRMLKSRHIQLISIGGTIGTALFVSLLSQDDH